MFFRTLFAVRVGLWTLCIVKSVDKPGFWSITEKGEWTSTDRINLVDYRAVYGGVGATKEG